MANMQERLDRAVEQTEVDSGIFHHIFRQEPYQQTFDYAPILQLGFFA